MHFSKTYSELLLSLPPSLRANTIEYRKLKKLINAVVNELESLGFTTEQLHQVLASTANAGGLNEPSSSKGPQIVYGVDEKGNIESKIHLEDGSVQDIPLLKNTAFFTMLSTALLSINDQAGTLTRDFEDEVSQLARSVSNTATPASLTNRRKEFHSAVDTDPATLQPMHPSFSPKALLPHRGSKSKSDLPIWRQIFSLYMDISPFESLQERSAGERSLQEVERRLGIFKAEADKLSAGFSSQQSHEALRKFWELVNMVLDVKKYHYANAEALRKILKKHSKRTALPPPPPSPENEETGPSAASDQDSHPDGDEILDEILSPELSSSATATVLSPSTSRNTALLLALSPQTSILPRLMVQAIGEKLLVVVPHIDDYTCVICTSLAFKPIRLSCGHLFCVRCLVKMQKRGQGECPMCRSKDVVLRANRTNVDWALLNFMQDWFPQEAKQKGKENEKEAAMEELREMGIDPDEAKCVVM